jgi:hypothetical protein
MELTLPAGALLRRALAEVSPLALGILSAGKACDALMSSVVGALSGIQTDAQPASGDQLWGLWSRSMAWDQGPYAATDGCIAPIAPQDAVRAIRELRIDCVYSLFQVYHPRLWGPLSPGVEHDVWGLLRTLLRARGRGAFDAPIVRHWGFDVQQIDPDIARALDGHIFCNREKYTYWTAPVSRGGLGLTVFSDCDVVAFLDGDRPKLEFMNDGFSERLSSQTGEIHTVCIGRPFGIDYLAAARHRIHVHIYGNSHDDAYRTMAATAAAARKDGVPCTATSMSTPARRGRWPKPEHEIDVGARVFPL